MTPLNIGEIVDNQKLCEVFACSPQGGMRRSISSNSLCLIANNINSIYSNRWVGNVLHYVGMGLQGDQSIDYKQNKTLAESGSNDVSIHLFEVFKRAEYTYLGIVQLADKPYFESQLDENDNLRKVVIFPLKLLNDVDAVYACDVISEVQARKETAATKLSDSKIKLRALYAKKDPISRKVISRQYFRDPAVSEYAKRMANGVCQLCDQQAPFKDKQGNPYLETHHVNWMSRGGDDSITNTIALCPNCHRRMHALDDQKDVDKLLSKLNNSRQDLSS